MLRTRVRTAVTKLLRLAGVEATFARSGVSSLATVDRHFWEPFWEPNRRVQLYYDGLKRAQVESSDNLAKQCRLYSLQENLEFVLSRRVPGDVAECGCWKGHSSYIISTVLSDHKFSGTFHIFDSFEGGLSKKDQEDSNLRVSLSETELAAESARFASTEDEVRKTLSDYDFVRLYKGWIPVRFPEVQDREFMFVHVDVDLYQPTLDSMSFFYPRLSDNGCIVIDDYGCSAFPGARKAVDRYLSEHNCRMFYEVPMGGCFIIK